MRTPDFTGMPNLEYLNLGDCSNLEEVHHSLGCSRELIELNLSWCVSLKRFPCVNVESLESLNLQHCSSLEKFPEILGRMKPLELKIQMGDNVIRELPSSIFQHQARLTELDLSFLINLVALPRSIGMLKGLVKLHVRYCSKVKSDIHMLDSVMRDLKSMYISFPRSLSQDIVSLQQAISALDSLSQRVFTIVHGGNKIPSWFQHRGTGKSLSVNLPENWYVRDNFLGFAVCYSGNLIETTVQLLPLCNDGVPWITWELKLSDHSKCDRESTIHLFFVPLVNLWDTSMANCKTPNDCGLIRLSFSGGMEEYGFRLLYKYEPETLTENNAEHCIGTRRSRYENSEHHDSMTNEASCSSSKKQRSSSMGDVHINNELRLLILHLVSLVLSHDLPCMEVRKKMKQLKMQHNLIRWMKLEYENN